MLFRSILLWLAFILVTLQFFWDYNGNILFGIIYRLLPTAILLLWFGISLFVKDKIKIDSRKLNKKNILILKYLRPVASLSIVTGAIFKYLHIFNGNILLAIGLFAMAFYSSFLYFIGYSVSDSPNDILDDQEMMK